MGTISQSGGDAVAAPGGSGQEVINMWNLILLVAMLLALPALLAGIFCLARGDWTELRS